MTNSKIQEIHQTPNGKAVKITENLHAFRVPKNRFRHGQSYALVQGEEVILIDAVHEITKSAVDKVIEGKRVSAIILSHSDLIAQAFGSMKEVSEWLNAPVFAHSADIGKHEIEDISRHREVLERHGLEFFYVPGHTLGSIIIHRENGNQLFVGDCAVGEDYGKKGNEFTHAPIPEEKWTAFERAWNQIEEKVSQIFPLHGKPSLDLEDFDAFKQRLLVFENMMKE